MTDCAVPQPNEEGARIDQGKDFDEVGIDVNESE